MLYTDNKNTRLMFEMYSQLRQYYLEIADDDSHKSEFKKVLFLIYRTPDSYHFLSSLKFEPRLWQSWL